MVYSVKSETMTGIADAIREKTGKSDKITPESMPDEIRSISGGGEPEPPQDGKTRLYITVPSSAMNGFPSPRNKLPLYIRQTVENGVTIDWGDESQAETIPGTGNVSTTHEYANGGDYVITLEVADGCELSFGHGSSGRTVFGPTIGTGHAYVNMLNSAVIGESVSKIASFAFYYFSSLSSVAIPDGVVSIESNAFSYCYSLSSVINSGGVTSVGFNAFANCYSLSSAIVSENVDRIDTNAFYNCYSLKELHLLPSTPPTLSGTTVLTNTPDDLVIYVPAGTLEAYQSATNWSAYADHMQEAPQ